MYDYFTPSTGLTGGTLIGLSAATLLLFDGDILGASGIMTSTVLHPRKTLSDPSQYWKLVLLASFCLTSSLLLGPEFVKDLRSIEAKDIPIPSALAYTIGGFLVGVGTKLGNGCTSGHGVCGMGRFSKRSFAAVGVFMLTAVLSSIVLNPAASWANIFAAFRTDHLESNDPNLGLFLIVIPLCLALMLAPSLQSGKNENMGKILPSVFSGSLFATGLAISQMVVPSKLHGFLDFSGIPDGRWDPTLATVLGAAVPVSMISYQLVQQWSFFGKGLQRPLCANEFSVPTNSILDRNLIVGAAIFGIGWSMAQLCPGPALFHAAVGDKSVILNWMPAFYMGSHAGERLKTSHMKMN